MDLDKKDCLILNILQENCRASLTEISKKIGLSIDSTKKRLDKMIKNGIFHPKIQIRPRKIGFPYIVDVKVRLHNYKDNDVTSFIEYIKNYERVAEFFSISGNWDFTVVFITKDHEDFALIKSDIKKRFSDIIDDWSESPTSFVYKFERYDLLKLIGHTKNNKRAL